MPKSNAPTATIHAIALASALILPSYAAATTTGEMLSNCAPIADGNELEHGPLVTGICLGFAGAFLDLGNVVDNDGAPVNVPGYCLPKGVTTRQIASMFVNYARAHPERYHLVAHSTVVSALMVSFPCPPQQH